MPNLVVAVVLSMLVAACATMPQDRIVPGQTPYVVGTPTKAMLEQIPNLDGQPKITIAVYTFPDLTGQRKPSSKFSQLSTAVSQGTDVWVIQALKAVSKGNMFQVVERGGLDHLVKERQLIRSTRELYDGDDNVNSLKPMLFAGLILEGGIIGYDSNVESGGQGARYFGIGAHEEYRVDQVTVSMRLVAVQTGEILLTQEATKTIASHKAGADVFRFLDMSTKAFEVESGVATNEPVNYAIRSAIEFGLYEMIKSGENIGMWKFKYDIHEGM
tara:strand:+ start:748 stop:1563 length:816 start_codon:yes stop_codon:yes gene_type:complete